MDKTKAPAHYSTSWLAYLVRIKDITLMEIKVVMLLEALSGGAGCVHIEFDDLRITGMITRRQQEAVLEELQEKNIVVTFSCKGNFISEHVCPNCPIATNSKACVSRKGTMFINRNRHTWNLGKKTPNYMVGQITELMTKNHIHDSMVELDIKKLGLNRQIQATIKAVENTKSVEEIQREFLQEFGGRFFGGE